MTKHSQTALIQISELDIIFNMVEVSPEFSANLKSWVKNARLKLEYGLSMERAFGVTAKSKKAHRNDLLRHYASALVVPSYWDKAHAVLAEVNRLNSGRKCSPMIRQANDCHRIPTSHRHIYRILIN